MVHLADKKYNDYANLKAKMVTTLPVEVYVNSEMHSETCKAKILKYNSPRKYRIVFAGTFYNYNKNNTRKINDIIEHELAHIKYPHSHGVGFRRMAEKLGAPIRYQQAR